MPQNEHDRRVDYIEFPATDLAQTKTFYTNAFDWKFTDYGPTYTAFEDGRLTGGFTTAAQMGVGGTLVVIYAIDIEAVQATVRRNAPRVRHSTSRTATGPPASWERRPERKPVLKQQLASGSTVPSTTSAQSGLESTPTVSWTALCVSVPHPRLPK